MKRLVVAVTIIFLLVSVSTIYSQRNGGPRAALYTDNVAFSVNSQTVACGNWHGSPNTASEHTVKFIADTLSIDHIYLTVKIPNADAVLRYPVIRYTDGFVDTASAQGPDGARYYNYTWAFGTARQFVDSVALLDFTLIYGGGTVCPDSIESPILITFGALSDSTHTFLNICTGPGGAFDPWPLSGYQNILEPVADVGVLPTTAPQAKVQVDHGCIGDQTITVPIYMRNLSFNFVDSLHLTVGWDADLDLVDFQENLYFTGFCELDPGTEQLMIRSHQPPYTYADGLPAVDSILGTLTLAIANTATEGESLKVYIKETAYFAGCPHIFYVDSVQDDTALVKVDEPDVTLKVGNASMTTSSGSVAVPIMVKTNVPLQMNVETGFIPLTFLNDLRNMNNTVFDSIVSSYTYGGTGSLKWKATDEGVYKQFHENQNALSTVNIAPSTNWQQIGAIRVHPTSVGTDTIFGVGDDTLVYVTVKYAGADSVRWYWDNEHVKVGDGILTVTSGGGGGGGGCPALYAHDGHDFRLEDFILTQTQSNPQPQNDYLPLQTFLNPIGGKYRLSIREFEKEVTYLDASELIVVDHPMGTSVGISTDGRVYSQGEKLLPIEAVNDLGEDILPLVGLPDGTPFVASEAGSMTVTYLNPHLGEAGHLYIIIAAYAEKPPEEPGEELTRGIDDIFTEIEDVNGVWHYLGGMPPRDYTSLNSQTAFDSKTTQLGETFRVRITWQREYVIDCQQLQLEAGANLAEYRLKPVDAEHSEAGKVAPMVSAQDDNITTIVPGQSLDLAFDAPPAYEARGYARSFFFHAYGYYKRFNGDGNLPHNFALGDNYPNPFNPSTTISLSLPTDGQVTLVIYNMLGQEVKTLYEGVLSAGSHDLIWNGDDNAGNKVSSGVYLYRMIAPGFEQSKKMTLIK